MVKLESLQLFVRAAEYGSLSKAAEKSNLAIAAVSRRIGLLEAYYGTPLLIRTGRGVKVTPAGQVLLDHAQEILLKLREVRSDLSDFAKGLRGTIKVHACTSAISQFLPQDFATFVAACPRVRLDVREAYSSDIVPSVRDGIADVGVIMPGVDHPELVITPYRRDRLTLVARQNFLPGVSNVRLCDVLDQDFVMMEDDTSISRLLTTVTSELGLVLRRRVKVGSFDAVCRMIQAGFGIGILPRVAAQNFEQSMGLRLIDLEDSWAERQMRVCTRPFHQLSPLTRRLREILVSAAALESKP
ncbi:MAG TPA: LysR family transcriptional regulator [Steroidobacteraceae bacterium]